MAGVEQEHGVDFSAGIPAAYGVLGGAPRRRHRGRRRPTSTWSSSRAMRSSRPRRRLASMATATGSSTRLGTMYRAFIDSRHAGDPLQRPRLHRLPRRRAPRPQGGRSIAVTRSARPSASSSDLLGPAVTVAHRLLKNTVRDRIGYRPYLFLTDAAVDGARARPASASPIARTTRTPARSMAGWSSWADRQLRSSRRRTRTGRLGNRPPRSERRRRWGTSPIL